jgi:hypothetical protein
MAATNSLGILTVTTRWSAAVSLKFFVIGYSVHEEPPRIAPGGLVESLPWADAQRAAAERKQRNASGRIDRRRAAFARFAGNPIRKGCSSSERAGWLKVRRPGRYPRTSPF